MIEITLRLICDRCRCPAIQQPFAVAERLTQAMIDRERSLASKKRWMRCRLTPTGAMVDVCPACVEALKQLDPHKRKARTK